MDNIDVISKAKVLLEALPYIQRFRGSVFVIKYGGSFMDDPDPVLRARVATDIVFLASVGVRVVIVHGGGKAINRAMDKAGLKPNFNNGLRVTDLETVRIVEKTLSEDVNPEICNLIASQGGTPKGIRGNDVLECEKLVKKVDGQVLDLGFVGEIKKVDSKVIEQSYSDDYIPVISPTAVDREQQVYNTNADIAASEVAIALKARRLVYLCDVPGLMKDPNDPSTLMSSLQVDEVEQLKKDRIISSGMLPKVDSAVDAIKRGVHRVHFIDGRVPHSLLLEIFTDKGIGTEIVQS
jgi:acetylglutamate kinase